LAAFIWAEPAVDRAAARLADTWGPLARGTGAWVMRRQLGESPAQAEALHALTRRVLPDPGEARRLRVRLGHGPFPNAFTFPGGLIVLEEALICAAESPDEVAAVLAHEAAHVFHHHVEAGLVRGLALSFILGDLSNSVASQLWTRRYSRGMEAEADATALLRLEAAGLDGTALRRLLTRLEAVAPLRLPALLSTHPDTSERGQGGPWATGQTPPALPEALWQALRAGCS
jgi:Zn-dependent protease with chaperone function